ncbi:low molecular weight phosphatase family protein [Corynebacterium pseudopelargi]|uniref:Low molecular weight protein-tyrosine-phosphatase etp n=1 Tax=Corynebacterium pseudopelargi TaxID=2080757 RepID=A0A3G6IRL8_9CORY|nr:low molecular weight phosphatase family protein [Corynebacterium pseudopelargi]AZA08235.1 Low molecular weight protein-tyrosine-phosphatase etp [Corynebacterium pseudopelargi]
MSSVLFICTANICRSPLAEALWQARGFEASSAGIAARNGMPMHEYSALVLEEQGIAAKDFSSTLVTPVQIANATVVLCMEAAQRSKVLAMSPAAMSKTFTLGEYAAILQDHPGVSTRDAHRQRRGYQAPDVADPIGGTVEDFRTCADTIGALLDIIEANAT